MNTLTSHDLQFETTSLIDPVGRVFRYQNRIFRLITDGDAAQLYRNLLENAGLDALFELGLVRTWIADELQVTDAELVLEHQRLPFAVHPAELTIAAISDAARMLVTLQQALLGMQLQLKDCHPWNLMLNHGHPVYVDFGSVITWNDRFCTGWYEELKRFYLIPLWLHHHYGERLAQEYRREHLKGFGQLFATSHLLPKMDFPAAVKSGADGQAIMELLDDVLYWLHRYSLKAEPKQWSSYQQSGDQFDPLAPVSEKHKFVFEWLQRLKPQRVLDMAGNKGFYSEVAARLGAEVICFDNEEFNIDVCNALAAEKSLNITAVLMDFLHPTPASGIGLTFPDAYQRFSADTVLVLGLIHHICLGLGIPLHLFLSSILRYQPKHIIIEYVFTDDMHVVPWKKVAPADYSFQNLQHLLLRAGFTLAEQRLFGTDGVHRAMLTFTKLH